MSDDQIPPYALTEPPLEYEWAAQGIAELLAAHLNVSLEMDVEDDEDYPAETQRVLDLAQDVLDKIDMLGLDLTWKDDGARLLAEAGTYGSA